MYPFYKIESKWQKKWLKDKTYEPDLKRAKKPFYNLMMFPYPSAEGLHVGNMYAFTGADIYGRLKRMQGYDVFQPIGLDGFGINSENYAIKIGRHPAAQSKTSEKNFYRQLQMIGNGFAWDERLETYDPEYYKWTQWIFIQLFKRGLAYRKKQAVNWCPSCKTVLADEQVENGKCERCGTIVVKKELEQWFFRITSYADKLLKNLDKIDWSEKVKIAQRNWIGKSDGATVTFPLVDIKGQEDGRHSIEVFTTRPDTIFGATFLVISPERGKLWMDIGWRAPEKARKYINNALKRRSLSESDKSNKKTGVFSGVSAINPANKEKIPVWISDYVLGDVGTGAIMAVPAHDERDWEFAKKFNLPIIMVVCPHYPEKTCPVLNEAYVGSGYLVASGRFDGMKSEEAKKAITKFVGGKPKVQYRLRDWLISRQRYWGPPIPMIFCEKCRGVGRGERKDMPGWYSVAESKLPVKLPFVKNFRPTGTDKSPLATVQSFYKVRCPSCKSWARRETDVSDTFLDSAWYHLRYPSVKERTKPWNPIITKKWLPVQSYIGGAEHSVLHLLYVRFLSMALHDIGVLDFSAGGGPASGGEEPFSKFRAHGLIIKDGAKMSKSKGNVVNPDDYIRSFGADALRMYLMFLGPFDQGGDFSDMGVRGITRFLERVYRLEKQIKKHRYKVEIGDEKNKSARSLLHKTIEKVTRDLENLDYNTAISSLMALLNDFEKNHGLVSKERFGVFLKLLAPFAPYLAEELWTDLGEKGSIHLSQWPRYEKKFTQENTLEFIIQVNGKLRGKVMVKRDITQQEATEIALKTGAVLSYTAGKTIKKVIFVPNRLINIVI
ncbi:MAG: leucine--tRNA ligase [Candidatus Colwellbacteria bacterium]|nr:leucine--tRNA ligase [Candidatus Colwellbacteria bacterium]